MKSAKSQHALIVSILYAIVASLWIAFSDRLLALCVADPQLLTALQTIKGSLFVITTAGLLYLTLRKFDRTELEPALESTLPLRSSLRGRVVGLVVLATLPLIALTIYNGIEQQRADRADVREEVLRFARLAVARQERIIDTIHEMLLTLTKVPSVTRGDGAECDRLLASLQPLSGRQAMIGVVRPDGSLFASAPRLGSAGNYSDRAWFQDAELSRDFAVDYAQEFVCAQPAFDNKGQLKAIVFASVDLEWIDRYAADLQLPPGAVITLLNRDHVITARSTDAAQWRGHKWVVARDKGGVLEGPDVDGIKRIQAILPAGPGWIIVGLPSTLVTMDSNRTILRNLGSIALVALAAIAVALAAAEWSIFRHLRELTTATRRLSTGILTERARLEDAPGELREVGRAFDEMAASLEQRTRERAHIEQMLREAEAKLRGAVENLPFEFWLADTECRYVVQNAASIKRWGDLIGHRPEETGLAPEITRTWQRNQRCALSGEVITREVREERGGETRHYQNIVAPILVAGKPTGVLGVSIDVTDHRRSEETLRALTRRLRAVREEESTRIAREVHDELGQAMTALKFDLAWCSQQVTTPALKDKLTGMTRAIDTTIQTVRRIAAELRPGVLDNLGLVAAIEWQAQDFQRRTGITCHTNLPEAQVELGAARATTVFRIFQEALTNVARHSKATKTGISLVRTNGHVILEVADNGVGLKTDPWHDPHSLGLLGMRERARAMNGDVLVKPGPLRGTVVTVSLPMTDHGTHTELAI